MLAVISTAIVVGAIIGGLGRLAVRGKQDISLAMTVVIGIGAALVGGFLANILSVGDTRGIDWIELTIQVVIAAVGVSVYTGGSASMGRARRG